MDLLQSCAKPDMMYVYLDMIPTLLIYSCVFYEYALIINTC